MEEKQVVEQARKEFRRKGKGRGGCEMQARMQRWCGESGPVSGLRSLFIPTLLRAVDGSWLKKRRKEERRGRRGRISSRSQRIGKKEERGKKKTMLARTVFSSILLIGCVTLATRAQFRCPEPKGFFPDPEQCDLYYACADGKAEEKLCKDGLVFRDDNPKKELCDIPANVPCGDRTLLRKLSNFFFFFFYSSFELF